MSVSFPTLDYTFPVPKFADGESVVESSEGSTIKDICEAYKERFGLPEDESNSYDYGQYINTLFSEVNAILGRVKEEDYYKFDDLGTSGFYKSAQTIEEKCIDEICQEGFLAYRFYLKEISSRLQRIDAAIKKGQAALEAIKNLDSNSPEIIINGQAHFYITELEIQDKFIHEELQEFSRYYRYNNDTKQWDAVLAYTLKMEKPGDLSSLRNLMVEYTDSQKTEEEDKMKKLTAFYELPLLDRLRYIRWYYELIIAGDTNYSIFPAESSIGYPCLPDIKSTSPTEDTKKLGALELFYLGYLIERDGPVNAVASFFEVKVEALRNNISLMSKKIEALNIYLDFINRGMDLLNQSQGNGNKRIPDGSIIALTYLCGQNMYNLFETEDGTKCLVLESAKEKGKYLLVEAGEGGKKWLMGDSAFSGEFVKDVNGNPIEENGKKVLLAEGNGYCTLNYNYDDQGEKAGLNRKDTSIPMRYDYEYEYGNSKFVEEGKVERYYFAYQDELGFHKVNGKYENDEKKIGNTFVLPTQIEVTSVLPNSVQRYDADPTVYNEKTDKDAWKNVIESWTTAFSNKTQYINTAIDTINTDVTVDRSKVDTFDSLASTFRSRAHDAYLNTVSNIR